MKPDIILRVKRGVILDIMNDSCNGNDSNDDIQIRIKTKRTKVIKCPHCSSPLDSSYSEQESPNNKPKKNLELLYDRSCNTEGKSAWQKTGRNF